MIAMPAALAWGAMNLFSFFLQPVGGPKAKTAEAIRPSAAPKKNVVVEVKKTAPAKAAIQKERR